ncbi:MAG TPA: cysteate synthase, partial [Bacteroidales bacterium]|nr:cysteate synthase [Bacteroidales bacterium]
MNSSSIATPYQLISVGSNRIYQDDGWMLEPDSESQPSLLRTVYRSKQIQLRDKKYGLYQYADWMPIRKILNGSAPPFPYKSKQLADVLGLHHLWITFSGYWPEKGSLMKTCTFKETEAYSVCARLPENMQQILVVASAGNTARAFARVCSNNQIPLLLCVPVDNIDVLWSDQPFHPCVKLICTDSGSDYSDAIYLSNLAASTDGFLAEGGAKNVARRDGMASTFLSAVHAIGQIPEYYFQAVGSGTGAIAAWEANLRLIEDGRFGYHKAKLILSQNE